MKPGKPVFNKRTLVIAVIAILIGLNIALSVTCVMLFNWAHERNKPGPVKKSTPSPMIDGSGVPEEATPAPVDYSDIANVIAEIENMLYKDYVRDRDENYRASVINGYLAATGDRYAYYYTPEEWKKTYEEDNGNSYGIGVMVAWTGESLKIVHVMSDSPAAEGGILVGDDIRGVNGLSFGDMTYEESLTHCRGEKGEERNFVLLRDGKEMTLTIVCGDYTVESVFTSVKEHKGVKIGVIECTQFIWPTPGEIKKAVEYLTSENVKGIIFDMRGNPGGLLSSVVDTLDYLLPEGTVVKLTYRNSSYNEYYSSDAAYATDLPFVILADGNTASAGELFTSCMKDFNRATVIGTRTFGKGCGQTPFPLSDGGYVKFTTFFYAPPVSDNYDGIGIEPDIEVELPEEYRSISISLIPAEEDTQMQAALDFLTK